MDNDNSGDIYIRLGLDEKEFYAGLDRAQSGVLALTESVQQSGERLDSMTKMSGGKLGKMGEQIAAVGKDIETAWAMVEPLANANQEAIRTLQKEYDKLGHAAAQAFMSGNDAKSMELKEWQRELGGMIGMYKDVGKEIAEVTRTLQDQDGKFKNITHSAEEAGNTHTRLRTQLMQVRGEMQQMILSAREQGGEMAVAAVKGSDAYKELQNKARDLGMTINEVNKETQLLATNTAGLQGAVSGLQGLVGGFSAVQGALAIFGTASEDLQKVQTKVQGCIAAMMGLQTVMRTLQKNSAFMLMMSKLKTAFIGAAVGANTATVSVKALWAALRANPLGLILTAATAVVAVIGIFVKKQKEQNKKLEEAKKIAEEFKEKVGEMGSAPVAKLKKLQNQWNKLGDSLAEKKKFIEKNQKAFKDLGVAITSVADAENLLVKNTDAFVSAQVQRAIAASLDEDIMKAAKEYVKARDAYDQSKTRYETSHNAMLEDVNSHRNDPAYQDYDALHTPLSVRIYDEANFQYTQDKEAYEKAEQKLNELIQKQSDAAKKAAEILKGASIEEAPDNDDLKRLEKYEAECERLKKEYLKALAAYREATARMEQQTQWDIEQISIDAMEDGLKKTLRQLKLNHEKEVAQIDEQEKEKERKWKELKAKEWAAAHPDQDEKANPYAADKTVDENSGLSTEELEAYREGMVEIYNEIQTIRDNADAKWRQQEAEAMREAIGQSQSFLSQRLNLERRYQEDRKVLEEKGATQDQLALFDEAYRAKMKELYAELIGDYAGYQQKVTELTEESEQKRRELQSAMMVETDPKKKKAMQAALKELERQYSESMRNIQREFIENSIGDVFAEQTYANVKIAIEKLRQMEKMTLEEFRNEYGDSNTTEAEFRQFIENVRKVKREIQQMGKGGYTLKDAFKDAFSGDSKETVEQGVEYLLNGLQKISSLASGLASAMREFAEATNNAHLEKMADTFQSIADTISTAGGYAAAGAQIGGGWGALIGAVLGIGQGVLAGVLKTSAQREAEEQQRMEEAKDYMADIESDLSAMLSVLNSLNTTISSLDYSEYRKSLLDAMHDLKNYAAFNSNSNWKNLYNSASASTLIGNNALDDAHIAEVFETFMSRLYNNTGNYWYGEGVQDLIERIAEHYNTSTAEGMRQLIQDYYNGNFEDWLDDSYTSNFISWLMGKLEYKDKIDTSVRREYANQTNHQDYLLDERRKRLIEEMSRLYREGSLNAMDYFNMQQKLDRYQMDVLEQKKREALAQGNQELADKYQQDIEELAYQMGERVREMFEGLAGIDLQGIVDKWLGIFREFGDDMTVVFSKIDESIDDMIRNMVMQAVFVQPLMQRLQKIIKDYEKQLRRQQGLGEDDIVDWTYANFREIAEAMRGEKEYAQTLYNQLVSELSAAGLDFGAASASDRTASSRGIAQASQESIDDLGGRATAIQEDTASIRDNTIIIQQTVAAIYGSVQRIEENTEELHVIKNIMRDMQSRGMQLRSS